MALPARPFQQRTNTTWRSFDPSPRFHGGCFGVWGTPPPKPLNCKSVSNRLGARLRPVWAHHTGGTPRHSCASIRLALSDIIKTSLCYRSQIVAFVAAISPSVSGNKKPCLRCGKQGEREIRLSFFRTCLHRSYPNYLRAVAQSVRGIASG